MSRSFAVLALIGALAASGCGGSGAAPASRCGRSYVVDGAWVGAGVGVGVGYGVGFYDPGDVYDPSIDYGTADDPGGSDDEPADTPGGDDPSSGDTSGDGSGGWDSTESMTHLHFTSAPAAAATSAPDANGCYTCTVGCVAGEGAGAPGRQAVGVSDTSYDDACDGATRSVARWAHVDQHTRLQACQRAETTSQRTPATPTAGTSAR